MQLTAFLSLYDRAFIGFIVIAVATTINRMVVLVKFMLLRAEDWMVFTK